MCCECNAFAQSTVDFTNDRLTGANSYTYHITDSFSCTSTNIIYAITCTLCPKAVYIGETMQTLRKRINGYRNDYKHNRNKPVAEHFNLDNHDPDNLKVMVLKYSTSNSEQDRLILYKNKNSFLCLTVLI